MRLIILKEKCIFSDNVPAKYFMNEPDSDYDIPNITNQLLMGHMRNNCQANWMT